jgi:hypothetical protein
VLVVAGVEVLVNVLVVDVDVVLVIVAASAAIAAEDSDVLPIVAVAMMSEPRGLLMCPPPPDLASRNGVPPPSMMGSRGTSRHKVTRRRRAQPVRHHLPNQPGQAYTAAMRWAAARSSERLLIVGSTSRLTQRRRST